METRIDKFEEEFRQMWGRLSKRHPNVYAYDCAGRYLFPFINPDTGLPKTVHAICLYTLGEKGKSRFLHGGSFPVANLRIQDMGYGCFAASVLVTLGTDGLPDIAALVAEMAERELRYLDAAKLTTEVNQEEDAEIAKMEQRIG